MQRLVRRLGVTCEVSAASCVIPCHTNTYQYSKVLTVCPSVTDVIHFQSGGSRGTEYYWSIPISSNAMCVICNHVHAQTLHSHTIENAIDVKTMEHNFKAVWFKLVLR